jgi:hypothetical protein
LTATPAIRLISQINSPAVEQYQLLSQRQTQPDMARSRAEERTKKPGSDFG